MFRRGCPTLVLLFIALLLPVSSSVGAQSQAPAQPPAGSPPPLRPPTRADILRGDYGRYRANNDLLAYRLDIRVDPERKFISGTNSIRFRMLEDDTRIQLELYDSLAIDAIKLGATALTYQRELNTVFVDFPSTLKAGRVYTIDFQYSGTPRASRGSTPPARARARASGGRARTNGATKSRRWRFVSRCRTA